MDRERNSIPRAMMPLVEGCIGSASPGTDTGGADPSPPPRKPPSTIVNSPTARPHRPPSWTDCFDPRRPEAFLAYCSLWCSMQMLVWPDQFANANALVSTAIGLRGHEQSWAIFGAVTPLLKLTGLACRLSNRWSGCSPGLLVSGFFMSVVFWMIVGLSRMVDFPHSITPIALTGFAIAAAWQLAEWRPSGLPSDSSRSWTRGAAGK